MDFSSNRFSVFQSDDAETDETVQEISDEKLPEPQKNESPPAVSNSEPSPWRAMNIGSWADAEEENDSELNLHAGKSEPENSHSEAKENNSKPKRLLNPPKKQVDKAAIRELDASLKSKIEIEIPYKSRVFDKETGKYQEVTNTRVLRVVSQQHYNQLQKLISGYKTHRGPNGEYVDAEKQKTKIKLANELLKCCAKDKNEPCCFVYAVAAIHTRDRAGNKKVTIRNEVYPTSRCYFECDDLSYRFRA